MRVFRDSSILIAALLPGQDHHLECAALIKGTDAIIVQVHALNEVFATLTGSSLGFRVDANAVARLIREQILPRIEAVVLDVTEVSGALDAARAHGVRGGAVYDYMHLVAARKAKVEVLYTLNLTDFVHLAREGDPEIRRP